MHIRFRRANERKLQVHKLNKKQDQCNNLGNKIADQTYTHTVYITDKQKLHKLFTELV